MNAPGPRRPPRLVRTDHPLSRTGARLWGRLPARLFHRIVDRIDAGLAHGRLEAQLPDGTIRLLGGRAAGPEAQIVLHSWAALVRLGMAGSVGWFRAWMKREWESPDPVALFALFTANVAPLGDAARSRGVSRALIRFWHALNPNSRAGARRNIAYHYDVGNAFYALWLDPSMTYSSALFASADQDLEDGQQVKIAAMLDRLRLPAGGRLLEIGCGWGSLAAAALRRCPDLRYVGLTLSQAQKDFADGRLSVLGLGRRATVLLEDYRDHSADRYDAIASVEMVEAIGQKQWPRYLEAISRLLKPGGRASIQFISIDDAVFERYAASADFIQTYIFPGGCLIARNRFKALAEASGLRGEAEHRFGAEYARTLRLWRERFEDAIEQGRMPAQFDEHFVRLWRYYLMYCEGGFTGGSIDVHQVTLVKA